LGITKIQRNTFLKISTTKYPIGQLAAKDLYKAGKQICRIYFGAIVVNPVFWTGFSFLF
jgi:hypothetical protein